MSSRVILHRVLGIRTWMRWDERKKAITIEFEEDDIISATDPVIERYWQAINDWCNDFVARNPGWTVNGDGDGDDLLDSG